MTAAIKAEEVEKRRPKQNGGNTMEGSAYNALRNTDVIGLLQDLFIHYGYKLRNEDGKIHATLAAATDTPWVHIRPAYRSNGQAFDCYRWHKIQFDAVSKHLKNPFVPSECQKCWKVVVRPQTLVQLFELENVQRQLDRPSKCGIEQRDTVHGLYGGYFYNESKEEGLECYNIVFNAMAKNELLKPLLDIVDEEGRTKNLLLKRACTEFEHLCGDSSRWEVTQEQLHLEALVNRYVVRDDFDRRQPEILVRHVRRSWIEFAYKWADPTYVHFTGGSPLYPHYVTYHQKEKRNGKERETENRQDDTGSNKVYKSGDNSGAKIGSYGTKTRFKSNKIGTKSRNNGGAKSGCKKARSKPINRTKKRDKGGKFAKQ